MDNTTNDIGWGERAGYVRARPNAYFQQYFPHHSLAQPAYRDAVSRQLTALADTTGLRSVKCDFNHPMRFELEYVGADGARHRPIMLHRALFGSIERFFGVLLEHYGGSFPTWLAPVQVRLLPVTSAHEAHVATLVERLAKEGFRVDSVAADEQLGKRIRAAKLERIPYVLVVGDDDVKAGTVGVNPRGGEVQRDTPFDAFVARLRADVHEGAGR